MGRGFISKRKYDEILDCKGSPTQLWNGIAAVGNPESPTYRPKMPGFKDDPIIHDVMPQRGLKILPNGIEIRDVAFTPEYQAALAIEQKMALGAKGTAAEAKGILLGIWAETRGMKEEELKVAIGKNRRLAKEFERRAERLARLRMMLDKGAIRRYEIPGADSFGKTVIAAADVLHGTGGQQTPPADASDSSDPGLKHAKGLMQFAPALFYLFDRFSIYIFSFLFFLRFFLKAFCF
jgi:hypothetical protein